MFGKHRRKSCLVLAPALLALSGSACNRPLTATDLTLQRMDETRWVSGPNYTYMADNARLHDMALADIHFVPHTSELSGTGAASLDRLAPLLEAYGGTVRYETLLTDEALLGSRLDHVREYLALAGCDMDRVEVEARLSGGRGMPADDAIKIKEKGTAKDEGSSSLGGSPAGVFGG